MNRTSTIILVFVTVLSVLVGIRLYRVRTAQASPQVPLVQCVSSVPQSWGQFKGGSEQAGLAFEDGQGTIRFITNIPCNGVIPTVALEVRRTK